MKRFPTVLAHLCSRRTLLRVMAGLLAGYVIVIAVLLNLEEPGGAQQVPCPGNGKCFRLSGIRDTLERARTDRNTMTRPRFLPGPFVVPLLAAADPARGDSPHVGIDFFEKKIRPALAENCYRCHSHAAGKHKGGLLLDSRDGIRKGGESGPAVVPG